MLPLSAVPLDNFRIADDPGAIARVARIEIPSTASSTGSATSNPASVERLSGVIPEYSIASWFCPTQHRPADRLPD